MRNKRILYLFRLSRNGLTSRNRPDCMDFFVDTRGFVCYKNAGALCGVRDGRGVSETGPWPKRQEESRARSGKGFDSGHGTPFRRRNDFNAVAYCLCAVRLCERCFGLTVAVEDLVLFAREHLGARRIAPARNDSAAGGLGAACARSMA